MPKRSRQELRADFMTQLLAKRALTVLDAILITDAIVRFLETGEIVGLSPGNDEPRTPINRRPKGRVASK